ncbi:hypothetical protein AB1Y20_014427 [Prymnesium parvum]|uniref:Uncharacterized protein n=1 Tax=Prymnesium parvum TaxID=97485 RepID=A0AB34IDZ6_PRYPA
MPLFASLSLASASLPPPRHRAPPQPYAPRGDCAVAERRRKPSPRCPRCEEVAGAGVCPSPGSFSDFALLFNHTYVLCSARTTCRRHAYGYWPSRLHERMTLVDARRLDAELAATLGPSAARLLGIRPAARGAPVWLRIVRHRILALLSSLRLVELAAAARRPHVLILEGDVRPVPRHALSASALSSLRATLSLHPWTLVRPSGYFFHFGHYAGRGRGCPAACRCVRASPRACRLAAAAPPCDVRDTVAFAAHAAAFPAFAAQRERSLAALAALAAAANRSAPPANATFGWPQRRFDEALPWFDKWLPAAFDTLYIVPSLVVQQVRQVNIHSSVAFARACVVENGTERR